MSAVQGPVVQGCGVERRRGDFVLGPLDLALNHGSWTSLRGPSGAGKSTLLQLLAGLDPVGAGDLTVLGQDMGRATAGERAALRRREIGIIFQDTYLLDHLEIWKNVSLRLVADGKRASERRRLGDAMLDRVGLGGIGDRMPKTLSGGERQRVGIARALLCTPSLILADEPTAAVDEENGALIFDVLEERRREGAALLVVSHDPAALDRADASLVLRGGQLSEVGP